MTVGSMSLNEGDVYVGEFKDDKMHGKGTYTWNRGYHKGDVYVGEYKDEKRNGYGKWTRADGSIYHDGMWKDGNRNGKGTYKCNSGSNKGGVYVGEFKDA